MYYAVFDANNFYVSCERVVNPKLQGIPVVVANPGGIILARSEEAKALGIQMAAPLFQIQELLEEQGVVVIPTHFSLYGDISQRIVTIIREEFPFVEEYSIDESFVFFPAKGAVTEFEARCCRVRDKIKQWTGIPVSVGIAATKTLAKVAVKRAKKLPHGVSVLDDKEVPEVLPHVPVGDVWGIGRALRKKLLAYGISTAGELAAVDPISFRKKFSVTLAYTIQELQGKSCFHGRQVPKPAQSILCSESYRQAITTRSEVEKKLIALCHRAGQQLRQHREVAGAMGLFLQGNRFKRTGVMLGVQQHTTFVPATAYTPTFTKFVSDVLPQVMSEGDEVKRAGVYLFDLTPENSKQLAFFPSKMMSGDQSLKEQKAMMAIDAITCKWGKKRSFFLTIAI